MSDLILPIFPSGSAASTVTTTVWVGVLVVVWANLHFGWTLSGLVVPGYLVPLMIIRPVSVAVILAEAVLTYSIVYLLSERCRNTARWSSLFGRDRFFALVLVSVLVRVVGDGILLPWLGETVNDAFGLHFNYQDQLHSVGLVIVALIANYFWKPGFWRGSGPLCATIAVTYLLIRYGLMPYTSFEVASLRYVYEDIASSLLASPKAYMVLLTTAFIASHMNLRYSWEYNGILIPALMALQWCEPVRLLSTLVEAVVVLAGSSVLLRLPPFRRTNMQDGRKIALFFTVGFLYRLSLAWIVQWFLLDWKVTDLHGFGYLLSTLLAGRVHERGHSFRIAVATTKVSFWGALVGSLIGYAFLYAPAPWRGRVSDEESQGGVVVHENKLAETLRADKLRLYDDQRARAARFTTRADISRLKRIIDSLLRETKNDRRAAIEMAHKRLDRAGLEVRLLEDRFVYLRDRGTSGGRGLFVFNLDQPSGMLVSVPHPLREPFSLEAGLCLFRDLNASILAVAGVAPIVSTEPRALVENRSRILFHAVHEEFGPRRTLQIRGYTEAAIPPGAAGGLTSPEIVDRGSSQLWVSGGLPHGHDLEALTELVGEVDVRWEQTPGDNAIRDITRPGFAELYLSRRTRTSLFTQLVVPPAGQGGPGSNVRAGRIVTWLLDVKQRIAQAGTEAYVPPRQEELVMLDQEVLQPLMHLLRDRSTTPEERHRKLRLINASAAALDYAVMPFVDTERDQHYLILYEPEPKRYWGTYVFRENCESTIFWEVPRPVLELYAFEFGVQSFVRFQDAALLVAGAHLHANRDGSSDVAYFSNKFTLFNLVHQALLREWNGRAALVLQARAIKDPVHVDVVLATDDSARSREELTPLKMDLVRHLERDGLDVGFVDGGAEFAGYELGNSAQWRAMKHSVGIEFVTVWLSSAVRWQYRQQSDNEMLLAQMTALGIPLIETDAVQYLCEAAHHLSALSGPSQGDGLEPHQHDLLENYLWRRDILLLQKLKAEPGLRLEYLVDTDSRQALLLIYLEKNAWPLVVNLAELRDAGPTAMAVDQINPKSVRRFLDARATWLLWRRDAP